MPGAPAWGRAPCTLGVCCVSALPFLCAQFVCGPELASGCNPDSAAAPLLIMRMLSVPLRHCRVPRRAVPLGMGSSDVGFKLPELSLGPELCDLAGPVSAELGPTACAFCAALGCCGVCSWHRDTEAGMVGRRWEQVEPGMCAACPGRARHCPQATLSILHAALFRPQWVCR